FGAQDDRLQAFKDGYPMHPELIATLTNKTATLENFQRIRGMLRLLVRTVKKLWQEQTRDAYAIHLHHIDPGYPSIRGEITTKLGQKQFLPAIRSDVAAEDGQGKALAEELDAGNYTGLAPYGSYAARTIFLHSLAFNEQLKGLSPEELRYAVVSPGTDISFIDDARKRFIAASAYLDDRPSVPLRFLAAANLTQII
ncbi:MAG: DUF499 domain-containing protein, partial [Gammaproteobacteria bacterium]|nr:DUF499 domain-containing protein [Gammaproteobacteria bacterium]